MWTKEELNSYIGEDWTDVSHLGLWVLYHDLLTQVVGLQPPDPELTWPENGPVLILYRAQYEFFYTCGAGSAYISDVKRPQCWKRIFDQPKLQRKLGWEPTVVGWRKFTDMELIAAELE